MTRAKQLDDFITFERNTTLKAYSDTLELIAPLQNQIAALERECRQHQAETADLQMEQQTLLDKNYDISEAAVLITEDYRKARVLIDRLTSQLRSRDEEILVLKSIVDSSQDMLEQKPVAEILNESYIFALETRIDQLELSAQVIPNPPISQKTAESEDDKEQKSALDRNRTVQNSPAGSQIFD